MCASSVWSERRNFLRAGTLKNRSRTVTAVPRAERDLIAMQHFAAGDLHAGAGGLFIRAGFEQQPRHRGDGRQRLAAKAQRGDGEQVFHVPQLAGGVPLEGQQRIVAQHPAAIVGDPDQPPSAAFHLDAQHCGAGVQRIFQQLFHYRSGPFHHLARRDLVGHLIGKHANAAHRYRPL